jgi:hypothetical protein
MTPNTFEDRLLAELREIVAARPAPAAGAVPRSFRRRLLVGGVAAGAAAAAAALFVVGGDPAAPAFAVERATDGSVTVEINSLRDADGLERKLRAAGIPAVVDYTPAGKVCREPRGRLATEPARHTLGVQVGPDSSAKFTIPRGDVREGNTVVIMSSLGERVTSLSTEIVQGPVAPCELVDAPPLPEVQGPGSGPEAGLSSGAGDEDSPSTHAAP